MKPCASWQRWTPARRLAPAFRFVDSRFVAVLFDWRDIAPMMFEAATDRVRVVSGDGGVAAYASVVHDISSDAAFVLAALVQQPPASLLRQQSMLQRRIRGSSR